MIMSNAPPRGETSSVLVLERQVAQAHLREQRVAEVIAHLTVGVEGVFVTGFGFPVVPHGQARVRCQISAAHTREDLDLAVAAFRKVGAKLQLI
jgi:glycine C-acetyltransferase